MNEHQWTQWPACPQCGRRRQTICPVCETAGNEFPLAEYLAPCEPVRDSRAPTVALEEEESGELEILLICPQCDEAFAPRFYRICPGCGHDFVEGMTVHVMEPFFWAPRVALAITMLVLGMLLMLLYFWLLFRP